TTENAPLAEVDLRQILAHVLGKVKRSSGQAARTMESLRSPNGQYLVINADTIAMVVWECFVECQGSDVVFENVLATIMRHGAKATGLPLSERSGAVKKLRARLAEMERAV